MISLAARLEKLIDLREQSIVLACDCEFLGAVEESIFATEVAWETDSAIQELFT